MYVISINPALWSSAYLAGKRPETFQSSCNITLQGTNAWATDQQLIIDASAITDPAGFGTLTITMLDIRGQERSAITQKWITTKATPAVATPFVTLEVGWLQHKTMSVFSTRFGNTYDRPLIEDVDWSKDKLNNRILILNTTLLGYEVQVSYWTAPPAFTYTDMLDMTVEKVIDTINRTSNIGVMARAVIGNKYMFVLESLMIGTNADLIEISRANCAAAEILINGADVDGPITLSGDTSNAAKLAVGLKVSEDGELYIVGIPGAIVTQQRGKEFTDEQFQSLDLAILSDLAVFVTKGILRVETGGAYLTAEQVIHAGHIMIDPIP